MSAKKTEPKLVEMFDPNVEGRTRLVREDEVKRWQATGWTSTEPQPPKDASKS